MTVITKEELEQLDLADEAVIRKHIIGKVQDQINLYRRADDIRSFRLLMYGTEGAGDKIIPWAQHRASK